jgi:hypothetical protein
MIEKEYNITPYVLGAILLLIVSVVHFYHTILPLILLPFFPGTWVSMTVTTPEKPKEETKDS